MKGVLAAKKRIREGSLAVKCTSVQVSIKQGIQSPGTVNPSKGTSSLRRSTYVVQGSYVFLESLSSVVCSRRNKSGTRPVGTEDYICVAHVVGEQWI